jgi:hypothetical protein
LSNQMKSAENREKKKRKKPGYHIDVVEVSANK